MRRISFAEVLTREGSLIAFRVTGDSVIGAAIADGDWVVARRHPDADSGDVVAAMLVSAGSADGEATVKTLKKADDHVWLLLTTRRTPRSGRQGGNHRQGRHRPAPSLMITGSDETTVG